MPLVRDIERLSRQRSDGVIDDDAFRAARHALLCDVPEADTLGPPSRLCIAAGLIARCMAPALAAGGIVFALGIPAMLSLTLGVTVLAASLIALYRSSDD